jgi:hypothetical protein
MEVSDALRLKSLEDENRRLKKLLAETFVHVPWGGSKAVHQGDLEGVTGSDRCGSLASRRYRRKLPGD